MGIGLRAVVGLPPQEMGTKMKNHRLKKSPGQGSLKILNKRAFPRTIRTQDGHMHAVRSVPATPDTSDLSKSDLERIQWITLQCLPAEGRS